MTDENTAQIINTGLDSLVDDAKATEDYTKQTADLIKKVETLVKRGELDQAVDEILTLEKKCRQACDAISCSKLCCAILQMYYDKKDWAKIKEYCTVLPRKRGQLRRVVTDMVQMGMGWLDSLDKERKLDFMKVLDQITEGKIFVEVERARLIAMMASMKEADGDLAAAAALLQEVQVETFGSMDKHEKAEYILNQMRVMLLRKDFIRVQIASRKINEKFLEADDFQDIKLQFYSNMVAYNLHEEIFLEATKCYQKMFHTKKVQDDLEKCKFHLSRWIIFLCLSAASEEQKELMKKTMEVPRKQLESVENLKALVQSFQTQKLIAWPLPCADELKNHEIFKDPEHGASRFAVLRRRVIQHNIRVISQYYVRISTKRAEKLLALSPKEFETELSELVVNKSIHARIDRPGGVIRFGEEPKAEDKMNGWCLAIDKVLDLVKETGHLIQKEKMIQEAKAKLKKTK